MRDKQIKVRLSEAELEKLRDKCPDSVPLAVWVRWLALQHVDAQEPIVGEAD
jgi:hypothetical protein